jgi:hypothetical protein
MSEMPPPPPGQPSPSGSGAAPSTDASGFFRALFDFSFSEFITPKVVKFVYILATILLALTWLVLVIAGFSQSVGDGLIFLIGGTIGAILYLALIRMSLEFCLAIVRMSQDIHHRLR